MCASQGEKDRRDAVVGNIRGCGRVNQPKLIRDPAVKKTVLQMLESAGRGFTRLDAVTS
jgi:hypothetical protein